MSLLLHTCTGSIPLPAVLVKLPDLCCNTRARALVRLARAHSPTSYDPRPSRRPEHNSMHCESRWGCQHICALAPETRHSELRKSQHKTNPSSQSARRKARKPPQTHQAGHRKAKSTSVLSQTWQAMSRDLPGTANVWQTTPEQCLEIWPCAAQTRSDCRACRVLCQYLPLAKPYRCHGIPHRARSPAQASRPIALNSASAGAWTA